MFYTVYKVTNKLNGKTYIGSHKTEKLDDEYMGSGKYLKRAIEKHGLENFRKEILHVFKTPEEMFAKEAELVNEEYLTNENTYNLKVGGFGGFDYLNKNMRERVNKISSRYMKRRYKEDESFRQIRKDNAKKMNLAALGRAALNKSEDRKNHAPFLGKRHTKKSKVAIGKANALNMRGNKNPQYGKMWITNGIQNTRILKSSEIPVGWRRGRI